MWSLPKCGEGKLFNGYLKIADYCDRCFLDLSKHDSGDGSVVPVVLFIGTLVCGLLLYAEFRYSPPIWVHMTLWPPVIILGPLALIRPIKAFFIGVEFKYRSVDEKFLDGRENL